MIPFRFLTGLDWGDSSSSSQLLRFLEEEEPLPPADEEPLPPAGSSVTPLELLLLPAAAASLELLPPATASSLLKSETVPLLMHNHCIFHPDKVGNNTNIFQEGQTTGTFLKRAEVGGGITLHRVQIFLQSFFQVQNLFVKGGEDTRTNLLFILTQKQLAQGASPAQMSPMNRVRIHKSTQKHDQTTVAVPIVK